jgi:hypothetical protein
MHGAAVSRAILVLLVASSVVLGFASVAVADPTAISSGVTLSGSIATVDASETYTFTGVAGTTVIVTAVTTAGPLDTTIDLIAPSTLVERRSTGSDELLCVLEESGTYTIVVSDGSLDSTGDYSVSLQTIPGATSSPSDPDGGAIASGETLSGTISAPAEMDAFTFEGTSGQWIMTSVVKTTGQLDTACRLISPTGQVVDMSYGGDMLTAMLAETGTYTIVVTDNEVKYLGTYNLTLVKAPGVVASAGDPDGGTIVSGETTSGAVNAASDLDAFMFSGAVGDRVIVHTLATSGQLVPAMYLVAPSGTVELLVSAQAELSAVLSEDGIYTVVVADSLLSRTGEYSMTLQALPGAISSVGDTDGGAIQSGETTAGSIGSASDIDVFTFSGVVGQRVIANIATDSGVLDTTYYLVSPSGDIEAAGSGEDQLNTTLAETGTYSILVWDHLGTRTGEYGVTLQLIGDASLWAGDPDGGVVVSGQIASGTVNAVSDVDAFTFAGMSGERVLLNAVTTTGTLDTAIQLVAPSGALAEMSYGTDQLSALLAESGTYTALVEDHSLTHTGTYNLAVQRVVGMLGSVQDPDGSAISCGQTLTGSIGLAADMDVFTFAAETNDHVIIDAIATSDQLDTSMILVSPSGAIEAVSSSGDRLALDLAETGTYAVVVTDYTLSHTGRYSISLVRNPASIANRSGSAITAYLSPYWLTGTLTYNSTPLAGRQVVLETSADQGITFVPTSVTAVTAADGTYALAARLTQNSWVRARFTGTAENAAAAGEPVDVYVRASVTKPLIGRSVSHKKKYTVYGYLKPRHTSGGWAVRIYLERYSRGKWRSQGFEWARSSGYSSYTKYSSRLRFSTGKWRMRALHEDANHVRQIGGWTYFRSK